MDGSDRPDGTELDGIAGVNHTAEVNGPAVPLVDVITEALAPLRPELTEQAAATLGDLRDALEARAQAAIELLDGHGVDAVVRIPKGRIADLQRCERLARARHDRPDARPPGRAALRGVALDRFVLLAVRGTGVREPTADLLSVLDAQGEEALCEQVLALATDDLGVFDDLVGPSDAWRDLPQAWWPRLQTAAAVALADGRVVCSGRLDAELGGALTDRPGVVIEVKSGAPSASHVEEVALYALLVGLRDGVPPALVVRWYPHHGAAAMPVDARSLASAAARLGDALEAWVRVLVGRAPRETPGPWCRWCPDAAVCPSSAAPSTDAASAGGAADDDGGDEAEWEPPTDETEP